MLGTLACLRWGEGRGYAKFRRMKKEKNQKKKEIKKKPKEEKKKPEINKYRGRTLPLLFTAWR